MRALSNQIFAFYPFPTFLENRKADVDGMKEWKLSYEAYIAQFLD